MQDEIPTPTPKPQRYKITVDNVEYVCASYFFNWEKSDDRVSTSITLFDCKGHLEELIMISDYSELSIEPMIAE